MLVDPRLDQSTGHSIDSGVVVAVQGVGQVVAVAVSLGLLSQTPPLTYQAHQITASIVGCKYIIGIQINILWTVPLLITKKNIVLN